MTEAQESPIVRHMPAPINQILTPFLASPQRPTGTLNFLELQGFLFAIASSPELVKPSEWLPLIFNEQDAGYASMEEGRSVLQALMELYNVINTQVFMGEVTLPDDITVNSPALENVGETTTLGQWSKGFFLGHSWLMQLWDHYTPAALDEELGSSLVVLSFFSSRELAEAYYEEVVKPSGTTLEKFAEQMLDLFEDAMASYAHLGRTIYTAYTEQAQSQQPYVNEQQAGRNDPCPCGSGKKYKKCCLQ